MRTSAQVQRGMGGLSLGVVEAIYGETVGRCRSRPLDDHATGDSGKAFGGSVRVGC